MTFGIFQQTDKGFVPAARFGTYQEASDEREEYARANPEDTFIVDVL